MSARMAAGVPARAREWGVTRGVRAQISEGSVFSSDLLSDEEVEEEAKHKVCAVAHRHAFALSTDAMWRGWCQDFGDDGSIEGASDPDAETDEEAEVKGKMAGGGAFSEEGVGIDRLDFAQ